MTQFEQATDRSALIEELTKMKKLGFLVVDEAFEVATSMDIDECAGLPISAVAFIASERGYAEFKSKLRSTAADM